MHIYNNIIETSIYRLCVHHFSCHLPVCTFLSPQCINTISGACLETVWPQVWSWQRLVVSGYRVKYSQGLSPTSGTRTASRYIWKSSRYLCRKGSLTSHSHSPKSQLKTQSEVRIHLPTRAGVGGWGVRIEPQNTTYGPVRSQMHHISANINNPYFQNPWDESHPCASSLGLTLSLTITFTIIIQKEWGETNPYSLI